MFCLPFQTSDAPRSHVLADSSGSMRSKASVLTERRYNRRAQLIAKTNAESARSANEISVGAHHFEFADGIADFDRANLRTGECDHFSEFMCSDKFHCCCAED